MEQKITYLKDTGKVLYRSAMTKGSNKKNFEVFKAEEFITAGTHQGAAIFMLPDVQQKTIEPILRSVIEVGSLVNTDEYVIYGRLCQWGYEPKTVCHAIGEYARDEDGDGFHDVHVNTIEGFWSFLRYWLRPHRGISQEKLASYLGFFEFIHNVRRRGKRLLSSLVGLLVERTA